MLPWFLVTMVLAVALVRLPYARAEISPEYKLKAIALLNFAKFVDWPRGAFPNEKSPIVIGVLG